MTVGAGGGSIARVDRAGRLRIGPESAGAVPGPAAYGTGGDRATLTDAHVVAGTLPAGLPLAGQFTLDAGAARAVIEQVAGQLGLPVPDAADGIIRLAVAQMTAALRRVSVQRGIDPRGYALVAFGGAGPLHAGLLLRELGFRSVLVPRYPGLFAASGLTSTDIRVDDSRTVLRVLGPDLAADLAAWYAAAVRQLSAQLRRDGIAAGQVRVSATADCRFVGQGYELSVPLAARSARGIAALGARFRELHLRAYGHADPAQDVEVVNVRLSAFGALPVRSPGDRCRASRPMAAAAPAAPGRPGGRPHGLRRGQGRPGERPAAGHEAARMLPVYQRERIEAGQAVRGRRSCTSWTRPRFCCPASGRWSMSWAACGCRRCGEQASPAGRRGAAPQRTRSPSSWSAPRCSPPRWRWAAC